VLSSEQNLVILGRNGQVKKQVYYPAPQVPGLLRALYAVNAVRAGLYGAAASAYGDAFAQASAKSTDPLTQQVYRTACRDLHQRWRATARLCTSVGCNGYEKV
jgi:hypothetical protein